MYTQVVYTSTNTSLQTVDTFDLPTEKVINYKVHVKAGNTTWYSTLDISHNGVTASEQQYALAQTGITPLEFTVAIANNSGAVKFTPTVIPTTLSMERTSIACNLFSENTLSGRNILTDEGLGIYFNGANNITIRQSNNNVFTYANAYLVSSTLGPIKTKQNLISNWSQSNGSIQTVDGNYLVAVSSGQKDNCLTQTIPVTVGKKYILTGNAYYTTDQNYSSPSSTRDSGASRIEVGTTFGTNDLGDYVATLTENSFSIVLTPTTDTIVLSAGFGDINNRLYIQDFELKEYAPFHTYNQDEGSIYIKWNVVAAGSIVFSLNSDTTNNRIYVDGSNNIYINSVNCGAQQVTNKIALSYNANGIVASRNGNAIVSSSDTFNKYISSAVFATVPYEFSYMPNAISNTTLVALSNV